MGDLKNKSKGLGSDSASSTSAQSHSNSQSGQPLVEQRPKQATLSPPTPTPSSSRSRSHSRSRSRSRQFFRKLGFFSSPPSPPPGVADVRNPGDDHTAPPASQSLALPTNALVQPHSSPSAQKIHGLLTTGNDVTAVTAVSSFDNNSSSSPGVHSSLFVSSLSAHVSTPIIREPTDTTQIKVDVCAVEPPMDPAPIEPPANSSAIWAKTLELADEKLTENKLPKLDLKNLASQSVNIEAVVKSLNDLQQDEERKKWGYTWRGKKIVIAERLGEIIRSMGKYSGAIGTAVQCDPLVGTLVWAGIQGIMQVALNHVEAIEGFEVAIAALVEKLSICEFYSSIYTGVPLLSLSTANSLQLQNKLELALPELYASVVVFSIKARAYFESTGIKKFAKPLKSFDLEFQPFIEEINAKERAIQEWADAATMERVKCIEGALQGITSDLKPLIKLNDISTQAIQTLQDDRIMELLYTLTPLEPLKRHQDIKLPRAEYTGVWLLQLESFCKWQDGNITEDNSSVFCCYGIPGAGKTVICSAVIDYLYSQFHQHPTIGIACLYADYKDQNSQTLVNILGTFLHQLLTTTTEPIPDKVLDELQDIKNRRGKLGTEDCLVLLKIRLHQLKCAFICIDAVDELEPKVRRELLNILKELCTENIRLFLTGRQHIESDVQKCFQQKYRVIISASQQDIEVFLRKQIHDDPYAEDAMDQALEKDIIDTIVKRSHGMFLLPTLHITTILEMKTISRRREALELLPTDLNDSFRGIINRIQQSPNASAELGMQVLMWLHFAYRPLRLVELQHALAVRKSHMEFDHGNIPSRKVLLDCCLGLVIVDEETMTVRFTHFTLEEYFRGNAASEFPNGCSSIAETCLTYLNFSGLRQHCPNLDRLEEKSSQYALLKYAACYWGTYVKQQCSDTLIELARVVLEHETERPPCAVQALYFAVADYPWERIIATKFSGIHVIAYFGLNEVIANFFTVELRDDTGRTPLSWAAKNGHVGVVQLLVEKDGVDINTVDSDGRTPLMWATIRGHEAVVSLLIERDGVDIDAKDNLGKTAFIMAAQWGHEAVVRLLIERGGVDINARDNLLGMTPFMFAATSGVVAIVKLLVERDGVDINAKDHEGRTPLMWAIIGVLEIKSHEGVVQLLIERDDVDISAIDDMGRTALAWAVVVKRSVPRSERAKWKVIVQRLKDRCNVRQGVEKLHQMVHFRKVLMSCVEAGAAGSLGVFPRVGEVRKQSSIHHL